MAELAKRYIFLLCSERSGSNLLNHILNAHSKICAPSPAHLFRMVLTNYHRYGRKHWDVFLRDTLDYFNAKLGKWETEVSLESLSRIAPGDFGHLLNYFYEQENKKNAPYVLIKENHLPLFWNALQAHDREAKFIHLIRDPRDFYASYKLSPNHPLSLKEAMQLWLRDNQFFEEKKKDCEVFTLKYEALVSSPVKELRRVCQFLEVDFESSMLTFHENQYVIEQAERVVNWDRLASPISTASVGRFREVLTNDELQYIQNIASDLMQVYGYEKDVSFKSPEKTLPVNVASKQEIAEREHRQKVITRILGRTFD